QGKREIATILSSFSHADDATGTDLDARLLEIADCFKAIIVAVSRARLRKEAPRRFKVVAVAFQSGFLQAVGDALALDNAERRVGAHLARRFHLADAIANLVQHGSFVEAL